MIKDSDLGLVTCYFNPCNYARRRQNFQRFLDGLKPYHQHLTVVELAFDDQGHHFANFPNHIGLRSTTMVWQKEALLNIGIRHATQHYPKVAWLDGDILFHNPGWYGNISVELEGSNLIQVFRTVKIHETVRTVKKMKSTLASIGQASPATGFGWAAKSEMFTNNLGLYDHLIVGGGDTLIYAAAHGSMEHWMQKRTSTYHHARHILDWAEQWYARIDSSLGWADNEIETFYHGSLKTRRYMNRHDILKESSFDPYEDIEIDSATGLLEWRTGKTGMVADIRQYFADRKEDT